MLTIPPAGVLHYIVLTQPWATLMAIGAKRVETRGWPTRFRGAIAISAAKGFPWGCRELCYRQIFADALAKAGIGDFKDLPLGKVLAVTDLYDCRSSDDLLRAAAVPEPEFSFGDYGPGRYGFMTRDVRRLREPMPLRGLQRIQKLPRPILEAELL